MSLSSSKVVQAYIQGMLEVSNELLVSYEKAKNFKSQFEKIMVDIKTVSELSEEDLEAINTFHQTLDILAKYTIINTLKIKDVPSHGIAALEIESQGK